MLKKHRIYLAEFEISKRQDDGSWKQDKVIVIENPITCNLNISVDVAGNANMGIFQFINLSEQVRADLWFDVYTAGNKRIVIKFYAGYGYPDETDTKGHPKFVRPLIFLGEFKQCISYKDGRSTEWITDIQAFEGGYFYEYGYINTTFVKGLEFVDVVNYMLESDKNTKIGYITPEIGRLPRNKTFIGQTMDLLGREYGGYEAFIDKGQFNILDANDVIPGELLVITDDSGLLGTPKRSQTLFTVNMLFEPQIRIGQAVSLMSDNLPQYNHAYKVMSVKHSGTISERMSGALTTEVVLTDLSKSSKRELQPAKPTTYEGKTSSIWDKPLKFFKITSSFGWRVHPIDKQRKYHEGLDMSANMGDPIYAPADGRVTFLGWNGGYGKAIVLDNGVINSLRVTSKYGHLSSWAVSEGQTVFKGKTILGYVGSTGKSTGPHLHFEVRENGAVVDPLKYIGS